MIKVLVNGTFDVLHLGHLELLEFAKQQGNWLIVAIDSDRRVKEKKGSSRPVNTQHERIIMMSSIKWVDEVCVFDTDQDLIDLVKNTDVLVKGSDHEHTSVIGREHCAQLIFFPRIDGYSTTKKIQDIIDRR